MLCNMYYLLVFFSIDPRNYIINVMIYFLLHTISCVALIYGAFKVGTLLNITINKKQLYFNIHYSLFSEINYFYSTIFNSGIHKIIHHILHGYNIYDFNKNECVGFLIPNLYFSNWGISFT